MTLQAQPDDLPLAEIGRLARLLGAANLAVSEQDGLVTIATGKGTLSVDARRPFGQADLMAALATLKDGALTFL